MSLMGQEQNLAAEGGLGIGSSIPLSNERDQRSLMEKMQSAYDQSRELFRRAVDYVIHGSEIPPVQPLRELPMIEHFREQVSERIEIIRSAIARPGDSDRIRIRREEYQMAVRAGLGSQIEKARTAVTTIMSLPEATYAALRATRNTYDIYMTAVTMSGKDSMSAAMRMRAKQLWRSQYAELKGEESAQEQSQALYTDLARLSEDIEVQRIESVKSQVKEIQRQIPYVTVNARVAEDREHLKARLQEAVEMGKVVNIEAADKTEEKTLKALVDEIMSELSSVQAIDINESELTPWGIISKAGEIFAEAPEMTGSLDFLLRESLSALGESFNEITKVLTSIIRSDRLTKQEQQSIIGEILDQLGCPLEISQNLFQTAEALASSDSPLEDPAFGETLNSVALVAHMLNEIAPHSGRSFVQIVAQTLGANRDQMRRLLEMFEDRNVWGARLHPITGMAGGLGRMGIAPFQFGFQILGMPDPFYRPDEMAQHIKDIAKNHQRSMLLLSPLIFVMNYVNEGSLFTNVGDLVKNSWIFFKATALMQVAEFIPVLKRFPITWSAEAVEQWLPAGIARQILSYLPEWAGAGPGAVGFSKNDTVPVKVQSWRTFETVVSKKAVTGYWHRPLSTVSRTHTVEDNFDNFGNQGSRRLALYYGSGKTATSLPETFLFWAFNDRRVNLFNLSRLYDRYVATTRRPWLQYPIPTPSGMGVDAASGEVPPMPWLLKTALIEIVAGLPIFKEKRVYKTGDEMRIGPRLPAESENASFERNLKSQAIDAYMSFGNLYIQLLIWRVALLKILPGGLTDSFLFDNQVMDTVYNTAWSLVPGLASWLTGRSASPRSVPAPHILQPGETPVPFNDLLTDIHPNGNTWEAIKQACGRECVTPQGINETVVNHVYRLQDTADGFRQLLVERSNGVQQTILYKTINGILTVK